MLRVPCWWLAILQSQTVVQSMALGVDEFVGLLVLAVWFAPSELGCWDAAVFAVVPAVAGGHVVWGVVDSAASASAQSGCWGWAGSKNADHVRVTLSGRTAGEAVMLVIGWLALMLIIQPYQLNSARATKN